jgi:hypothetical protein
MVPPGLHAAGTAKSVRRKNPGSNHRGVLRIEGILLHVTK